MGGSKGGGTTTQSSTTTIPPEVLARYNAVNARAEAAASQPFTPYTGEFVAPVNQTQQGGIDTISGAAGSYQPYFNAATYNLNNGLAAAQPYYGLAGTQVASGYAGGTAGNSAATSALTGGLGAAQIGNMMAEENFKTAYNGAQPYNAGATGLALAGTQAVDPGALNIGQYMSPYTQSVINSTLALNDQKQAQERNALTSNAILTGSYGGDRGGVAKGVLTGQQDLARSNLVSGLYNQNYTQALGAAQQQQGVGLGAAQANRAALQSGASNLLGIGGQYFNQGMGFGSANQGLAGQYFNQGLGASQQFGNIGNTFYTQGLGAANANLGIGGQLFNQGNTLAGTNMALGTGLLGAQLQQGQAQLGAGTVAQQTAQAQDTAVYNQFLQQQGYPFQVAQFLANIAEGTGALSGSSTTGVTNAPQPFFSDERLKENIKTIGHTKDGLKIIRFNYKGSPHTQIGLSAQDVEKKRPEAVGLAGGFKTVDYDRATRALGGAVANDNAGMGYASGGMTYDPQTLSALLAAHGAMYPGAGGSRAMTGTPGANGVVPSSGGSSPRSLQAPALMKMPASQPSGLKQTVNDVNGVADLYKTGKSVYGAGKDAVGWASDQYDKLAHGSIDDQIAEWSKTPASSAVPADIAAPAPADNTLVDDAIGVVNRYRGGRAKRAAGGSMPYGAYDEIGIPDDVMDPQELRAKQAGLAGGAPGRDSHVGGGGGSGILGDVGGLYMLGKGASAGIGALSDAAIGAEAAGAGAAAATTAGMPVAEALAGGLIALKRGGRVGYDEGGVVDDLPPFEDVVPDNIIPFKPKNEGLGAAKFDVVPESHAPFDERKIAPVLDNDAKHALAEEHRAREGLAAAPAVATDHDVTAARTGALDTAVPERAAATPAAETGLVPPLPAPKPITSDAYHTPEKIEDRHWTQESGQRQFRPDGRPVTSSTGAVGWGQLQGAGPDAAKLVGVPWDPQRAATDEGYNKLLSKTWFAHLKEMYGGDAYKASAAYNAGSDAVNKALQTAQARGGNYWDYLPAETQNHLYAISGGQYGKQSPRPGGGTMTALNVPAATSPDVAAAAPSPAGLAAADITLPPKDLKKGDWLDRNERPIVTGLTFLGNMLGSKSHQLLGSIGEGLAAAAPAYAAMGFKQQEAGLQQQGQNIQSRSLDIQQRAQYMTLLTQLRTMQNARTARGEAPDPQLAAQIAHLAQLVSAPSNGPNGGPVPAGALPPGPLSGNPAAPAAAGTPPAALPAATGAPSPAAAPSGAPAAANAPAAPQIDPGLASKHPVLAELPSQVAQPAFLSKIADEENPFELYRRADRMVDDGDPNGAYAKTVARADAAARNLKELGYAIDKNGSPVMVPGWSETARAKQMIDANNGWTQKEAAASTDRQRARQSLDLIKEALGAYQSNAFGEMTADAQRYMKALNLPVPEGGKWNADAVQEILKQTAGMASRGDTDMARALSRTASIDPTKEPEANKKILAQAYADLNASDAKFKYLQPRISAVPQLDTPQEIQKWNEVNPIEKFYGDAYKDLAIRGATPPAAAMKPDHTYIIEPGDEAKYNIQGRLPGPTKYKVVQRDGAYRLVPVQ